MAPKEMKKHDRDDANDTDTDISQQQALALQEENRMLRELWIGERRAHHATQADLRNAPRHANNNALREAYDMLREDFDALDDQHDDLRRQNGFLQGENAGLRRENAGLRRRRDTLQRQVNEQAGIFLHHEPPHREPARHEPLRREHLRHESPLPPTALSPTQVQSLPKRKTTQADAGEDGTATCPICLNSPELGSEVTELPCKHWFHQGCIEPWLQTSSTCPSCRTRLGTTSNGARSIEQRALDQFRRIPQPLSHRPPSARTDGDEASYTQDRGGFRGGFRGGSRGGPRGRRTPAPTIARRGRGRGAGPNHLGEPEVYTDGTEPGDVHYRTTFRQMYASRHAPPPPPSPPAPAASASASASEATEAPPALEAPEASEAPPAPAAPEAPEVTAPASATPATQAAQALRTRSYQEHVDFARAMAQQFIDGVEGFRSEAVAAGEIENPDDPCATQ